MSRIGNLVRTYGRYVSAPWQKGLAGPQRVVFVVYDKTEELRLRAHITEFELTTTEAGHDWYLIDLTDAFPRWMAAQRYRESYFECPEDLDGYQNGDIQSFTSDLIAEVRKELAEHTSPSGVVTLIGVGSLFGVSHVSALVSGVADAIEGRLLVFFPGEHENNTYRLLDARDGWNYLAVPILASND
jgi:hypothetical protein